MRKKIAPTHPGDVLREEFLKPLDLTGNALALDIHVPASRIGEILRGERAVTAETDLRLAPYFGTSAQFWLRLQAGYDLNVANTEQSARIEREVRPRKHATG